MTPRHIRRLLLIALAVFSFPAAAQDLRPRVERLANGLTVMILEDHAQPLVSVQMLYRVGGRTENAGETGLAHFVEHMAFRATENFPDTQVVSRIYAAGAHGRTQTNTDLHGPVGRESAPRPCKSVFVRACPWIFSQPLSGDLRGAGTPAAIEAQLGYAVPAAGTSSREADAWRILLYIMSHGYEGRLGKELIGHLGLLYYIDSRYDSDGKTGWISLVTGVNPDRLAAARDRFAELLGRLRQEPPTDAEIDEAKQSLLGRRVTAPMSNAEITAAYAREWIEQGRLLTDAEFAQRVRAVTREQVLALVPRFLAGGRVVVE